MYSEQENSGIRVAVGDCSVTERWRWRPPYQTGKTVHMHANTLQTRRGRTHGAGCVRPWFHTAEPLGERRYENWITHISQLSDNSLPPFISWKKSYRKDDYTVDCPHLIKKRLYKTRIVDFHWAKLAISEILLPYFQGIGDSIVSGKKFYYENIIAIFLWYVCVRGGGWRG